MLTTSKLEIRAPIAADSEMVVNLALLLASDRWYSCLVRE